LERFVQSDYTSPVVEALLSVPSDGVPGELWRAVHGALTAWEPVDPAEAAALLDEFAALLHDPLADGQSPNWQWNLGAGLELLGRIATGEHVAVMTVLHVLRINLAAHHWRVDNHGVDRLADIRWRYVEVLARLLMDLEPTDWERTLMERPVGPVAESSSIGERIRHRRRARNLTQTDLAEKLGVVRFSVGNWEHDRARPTLANAIALTANLGGEPGDYLWSEP
jgi:DNA-binding XRE family transcriptional regulator